MRLRERSLDVKKPGKSKRKLNAQRDIFKSPNKTITSFFKKVNTNSNNNDNVIDNQNLEPKVVLERSNDLDDELDADAVLARELQNKYDNQWQNRKAKPLQVRNQPVSHTISSKDNHKKTGKAES